jgi:hypothetical protein
MPETVTEWFMFGFFVGGAAGGWIALILSTHDLARALPRVFRRR